MKTSQVRAALALLQWDVERLALAADIDPNRLKVMLATQGEFTSLKIDGEYITDGLHAEMKIHKALTLRGIKFINDWENPGVVLLATGGVEIIAGRLLEDLRRRKEDLRCVDSDTSVLEGVIDNMTRMMKPFSPETTTT